MVRSNEACRAAGIRSPTVAIAPAGAVGLANAPGEPSDRTNGSRIRNFRVRMLCMLFLDENGLERHVFTHQDKMGWTKIMSVATGCLPFGSARVNSNRWLRDGNFMTLKPSGKLES